MDAEETERIQRWIETWIADALVERDAKIAELEQALAHKANADAVADNIAFLERRYDEVLRQFATIEKRVETLEQRVDDAWNAIENKASDEHEHYDYASNDRVASVERNISSTRDELSNLEYHVNDTERKADNAQRAADAAQRQGRGYY